MDAENVTLLERTTGWSGPFELTVTSHTTDKQRHFVLERPYALVGSSSKCDITLKGREVGFRHAYLQVLDGRILCVDLASSSGTHWDDGPKQADWLTPDNPVRIGAFTIQTTDSANSARQPSSKVPPDFNPLKRQHFKELGRLPKVDIKFLNAQVKELSASLSRILTLVGRDTACKFRIDDKSISKVHCSLLYTPDGLWVIDLLGRGGTTLNKKRIDCAQVEAGDVLKVGRYRMRFNHYTISKDSALDDDETSSAAQQAAMSSILISSNKIFIVEHISNTLVLSPAGDARRFRYADVHREANNVQSLIRDSEFTNMIVDLKSEDIFGSITISLFSRLRSLVTDSGGQVAICNASVKMLEILKDRTIWPHFASREEALKALPPHSGPAPKDRP